MNVIPSRTNEVVLIIRTFTFVNGWSRYNTTVCRDLTKSTSIGHANGSHFQSFSSDTWRYHTRLPHTLVRKRILSHKSCNTSLKIIAYLHVSYKWCFCCGSFARKRNNAWFIRISDDRIRNENGKLAEKWYGDRRDLRALLFEGIKTCYMIFALSIHK